MQHGNHPDGRNHFETQPGLGHKGQGSFRAHHQLGQVEMVFIQKRVEGVTARPPWNIGILFLNEPSMPPHQVTDGPVNLSLSVLSAAFGIQLPALNSLR